MDGTLLRGAFVIWREKIDPSIKPYIPNHHIGQTLIPYLLDIVKPLYKGLALYLQNHGLSSIFVKEFAGKFAKNRNKFVIIRNKF